MVALWTRAVTEAVVKGVHIRMKGYIFRAESTGFANEVDMGCETRGQS